MPRPRVHDLDRLLDATERLAVESGPAAVTVRAISDLTTVSNGAIYNAFGSRAGLVGRVWLRAARRFLALQQDMVRAARASALASTPDPGPGPGSTAVVDAVADAAIDAVVAAADAPARFLTERPESGRFLLAVSRTELLGSADLPDDLAAELDGLDQELADLFVALSSDLWGRGDRACVDVVRDCVVELPTALLLRGRRDPDASARQRIAACVRAVLALGPPLDAGGPVGPTRSSDFIDREDHHQ
ncbi:TetR/AcrR family transcriptional regulator [uncultured Dietzia sp.]|uniref:TetR/AcrR family transcriptional regulator n=1 Tax=uncultured Dietzia sp. TaxID=395519 RepID=UPI0025E9A74C|nr:helix-turn-helix domain-containing protein [uncultured Dietzia sp.]